MRISCHLLHEIVEDISWKTSARSARIWVIVFREQNLHELLGQACHLHLGHPGQFPAWTNGAGRRGRQLEEIDGGICLQTSL